jgi:hypothetical protein
MPSIFRQQLFHPHMDLQHHSIDYVNSQNYSQKKKMVWTFAAAASSSEVYNQGCNTCVFLILAMVRILWFLHGKFRFPSSNCKP